MDECPKYASWGTQLVAAFPNLIKLKLLVFMDGEKNSGSTLPVIFFTESTLNRSESKINMPPSSMHFLLGSYPKGATE